MLGNIGLIFCEPDDGSGAMKPSFARVFGAVVIVFVLYLAFIAREIPDEVMKMFWALVGYSMISKSLGHLSPALLEYIRGLTVRANKLPDPAAPVVPVTPSPEVPKS